MRPLRHNGTPYRSMNILRLWGAAVEKPAGAAELLNNGDANTPNGEFRPLPGFRPRGYLVHTNGRRTEPANLAAQNGLLFTNGERPFVSKRVAPRHGFEPRFTAPKAAVLPLDDRGISERFRIEADLFSLSRHLLSSRMLFPRKTFFKFQRAASVGIVLSGIWASRSARFIFIAKGEDRCWTAAHVRSDNRLPGS